MKCSWNIKRSNPAYFLIDSLLQELHHAAHKSFTPWLLVLTAACVTELLQHQQNDGGSAEMMKRFRLNIFLICTNLRVTKMQRIITLLAHHLVQLNH